MNHAESASTCPTCTAPLSMPPPLSDDGVLAIWCDLCSALLLAVPATVGWSRLLDIDHPDTPPVRWTGAAGPITDRRRPA